MDRIGWVFVLVGGVVAVGEVCAAEGAGPPQHLSFVPHERIAFVGNSLAERMNLFGHFEAALHSRFPGLELVVRNFGRPCDSVDLQQRPDAYTAIDDPFAVFKADTVLCFFGLNEAFAGEAGEAKFRESYGKYLDELAGRYPRAGGGPPRFVLVSPVAWEEPGKAMWPEAVERNAKLVRYSRLVAELARERGLPFVDLFTPTQLLYAREPGLQFTINGCHLNEAGDRAMAEELFGQLFGDSATVDYGTARFEQVRSAVNDKSWVHLQDYRMLNGWYVYGGRRTLNTEIYPREYRKIRAMAAVRDRTVWDMAQGKAPVAPDDRGTGEPYVPPTGFGNANRNYAEPAKLEYLSPEQCIETMTVPAGFEVRLFASEREFPELAKPDQLNFDNRGRLWVSCMPTYPQWKPGDARPNDRLLIFEDGDGDGRADQCKVFYDRLHCPTGFEFWNGGVLVVDQPRLVWLKDTDGDDRADVVVHLLDGWASDDTHHAVGAFEYSNGGLLHMLEGIAMSTTVETPWGPFRHGGASGAYVLDPRAQKLEHFTTPGYGNPWCYVFDRWGQGFVGDGTSAQQHWDTPLSGAEVSNRRGMDGVFDNAGIRPCIGSEFLFSRQFPAEVQGQFVYACVIQMNGIPRFRVREQSAGFVGKRVMRSDAEGQAGPGAEGEKPVPDDLVRSTDKNFRPVDPQIGPDGALWFGDWCNALIGHLQYSQRDPNRDHVRGRVYRLVYKPNALLQPVVQYGKTEAELLEQLREYEPRTRYRARRELRDRPTAIVQAAVKAWVAGLAPNDPEHDRLRCEALWVLQGHHAVDEKLLAGVMESATPEARAAAVHVAADEREYLPRVMSIMRRGIADEHPRVRVEALRGLSFLRSAESVEVALEAFHKPSDAWIEYTLEHTLAALEPWWIERFHAGQLARASEDSRVRKYLEGYVRHRAPNARLEADIKAVASLDTPAAQRASAYSRIERLRGNAKNGQAVYRRVCATCHKVGDAGYSFGPDHSDVGKRLSRHEIVESIIEPNKKVDPKYISTTIITSEGKSLVGLLAEEKKDSVTLLMAEGKQATIARADIDEIQKTKVSSMPENLTSTLSPTECLDVVEYLTTLK